MKMKNKDLADLIFPNIKKTIGDMDKEFPKRNISENEVVTRMAPSPTGYIHIGNFFPSIISYVYAKATKGIFILRLEDTDQKREIGEAYDIIMKTLDYFHIESDEYEYKGKVVGDYGSYIQSNRKYLYHIFVKHFIEIGRAYPCFCSAEDLDNMREQQKNNKVRPGYYGKFAKCRNIPIDEAYKRIQDGESFVVRFKSMGDFDKKIVFNDLVKGTLELSENDQDIVIMKSDNLLPTYHFAHLVDDYLMKTTHIIRGDDYISSVTLHIELFNTLGVEAPKYLHTPMLLKKVGNSVRKISKRYDPEASMTYYIEQGYPYLCVIDALMTIVNSNYESWREKNPDASYIDFPFSASKISSSGAYYTLDKLDNISKNYISKLSAKEVYSDLIVWAKEYDVEFYNLIEKHKDYTVEVLNIEREQAKPRKDFAKYSDVKNQIWYMYDELFNVSDKDYEWQTINDKNEISMILKSYIKCFDVQDTKEVWFNKIKLLCDELGYASNMKEYKNNPDGYKGNVADISMVLRIGLTTKSMTPDLYEIMKLLGKDRIVSRFNDFII